MPFFYDYYGYLIFVVPAMLISLIAQIAVKSSFSKYSRVLCGHSGAEAAQAVLRANGVTGVTITRVAGNLTDHFDPRTNTIRLSDSVYDSRTISAVGVAAHEAGHAVQYAKAYKPIHIRASILPICNIGSQLSMPLVLLGIVFSFPILIDLGIIFFCAVLLFQLVTLPVELNASKRAVTAIRETHLLTSEEDIKGAKKVLRAAAMTYIAAVITAILQLLRLISLANRNRR
ncbi:MAG: zinc metallopeptidase [Ruminococcaceae bacterium]|nr:zinc metallopeptidase [Oscillospiraceae bacterium]